MKESFEKGSLFLGVNHLILKGTIDTMQNVTITIYKEEKKMAKKSKTAKYEKQKALIERYAEERYALKQAGDIDGLRKLPKNSNPNRLKFRDQTDGRPRGYMRKFGLSRIKFRELAHIGLIPGIKKASW